MEIKTHNLCANSDCGDVGAVLVGDRAREYRGSGVPVEVRDPSIVLCKDLRDGVFRLASDRVREKSLLFTGYWGADHGKAE